jgi:inner membrane protein
MRHPLFAKAALIAALVLVLMIPVGMIRGLVAERQARSQEAIAGIAEGWGKRQSVASPYLAIPYERQWTVIRRETIDGRLRETRTEQREAKVLRLPASSVSWTVDTTLSEKARGIYKARLYSAHIAASGTIDVPSRASAEDGTSRYRWHNPKLVVGISDPLGIRAAPAVTLGGKEHPFRPDPEGLHAVMEGAVFMAREVLPFSFTLELAGSEALALAPLGADTAVTMRADWPHPSFQGRFLPASHDIGASGFTAAWKISRFAAHGAQNEAIAVSFIEPVGLYQMLERASKYGFLFIGLTAAAFMLLELLRRLAIHPIQYALVGLALAIFFLLLTALSEHLGFGAAYALATAACVALVTAYLLRIGKAVAFFFGAGLTALYAVLYALLQSEDYALLGGSLLLFALLAALMLGTRRVDWYGLTAPATR